MAMYYFLHLLLGKNMKLDMGQSIHYSLNHMIYHTFLLDILFEYHWCNNGQDYKAFVSLVKMD